jgi:hypothetical protein
MSYIYILSNKEYENDCVYVNVTHNIDESLQDINEYVIARCGIVKLIEVPDKILVPIGNLIKHEFDYLNIKKGGSAEFFKSDIINLIEPFLQRLKISYNIK